MDISEQLLVVQVEGEEFDPHLMCSDFAALAAIAGTDDAEVDTAAESSEPATED